MLHKLTRSFANAIGASFAAESSSPETRAAGKVAEQDLAVQLPMDLHGHPECQTEWWYYTGHCGSDRGRRFGFELVFFRRRTDTDRIGLVPLRFLANPMYAAHFAITDINRETFRFSDRRGFGAPGAATSRTPPGQFRIGVGDWTVRGDDTTHAFRAGLDRDLQFDARLTRQKPVTLNGHGRPGPGERQGASQHFSFTRMELEGELHTANGPERVTGTAWMDREYGTWVQRHWDWFSVQLDDGCDLIEIGQTRRVHRIGAGVSIGDQAGDGVVEVVDAAEVVLRSTGEDHRVG